MIEIASNPIFPLLLIAIFGIYFALKKNGSVTAVGAPLSGRQNHATPTLDAYAIDFTAAAAAGRIDPVIGREKEILRLAQVLSRRSKNNAILVGEPGVGKTAVAEGLAARIVAGDTPQQLSGKRLLSLDVSGMLAGTKYRGEFEERAKKLVKEITQANRTIILFIDEIHTIIQSEGAEGAVNFADILKPALARGELQLIGSTTNREYEKYIKTDLSLERRFQPIQVGEPTKEQTLEILRGVKDVYRQYHKVEFTDAALEAAVALTQEKITDRTLPDKAIDALDEAAAMVRVRHIHQAEPQLLSASVLKDRPKVKEWWAKIQALDRSVPRQRGRGGKTVDAREQLEEKLETVGTDVVDFSDVQAVVDDWVKKV